MFLFLLISKDTNQGEGRAAKNLQTVRLWQRRADRKKNNVLQENRSSGKFNKKTLK